MAQNSYKILVIDDDPDIVELVRETLETEGYLVDSALSCREAEEYLAEKIPDLIVLDLILPDGDGYDLCRMITQNRKTRNTPVLMLTGKSSLDDRLRGFVDGARKYITKPFELDHLTNSVLKLLQREGPCTSN